MLHSYSRLFTVIINVSVTAMTSIISAITRHRNSSILFCKLRALKLTVFNLSLVLSTVEKRVLLDSRLWWHNSSDVACVAV